jgi:hypothetical protein
VGNYRIKIGIFVKAYICHCLLHRGKPFDLPTISEFIGYCVVHTFEINVNSQKIIPTMRSTECLPVSRRNACRYAPASGPPQAGIGDRGRSGNLCPRRVDSRVIDPAGFHRAGIIRFPLSADFSYSAHSRAFVLYCIPKDSLPAFFIRAEIHLVYWLQ